MTEAERDAAVAAVVRALADLAPRARPRPERDRITAPEVWLGSNGIGALTAATQGVVPASFEVKASDAVSRIAAASRLRGAEQSLRVGWAWVAGWMTVDGRRLRLIEPLLSAPVHIMKRPRSAYTVALIGDLELTDLVADRGDRWRLESEAQFGGGTIDADTTDSMLRRLPELRAWVHQVTAAAGLPTPSLLPPDRNPQSSMAAGLQVVAGVGLYLGKRDREPDVRSTLTGWSEASGLGATALGAVYYPVEDATAFDTRPVHVGLELTGAQTAAVQRSRTAPVSVVSGAPGNGKTHAAVAAAVDAVARGERVLVASKTTYAAEVIADFLHRHPGPSPVVFGSSERRQELARGFVEGSAPLPEGEGRTLEAKASETYERLGAFHRAIEQRLGLEATAASATDPVVWTARADVPAAFDPAFDLAAAGALLARAHAGGGGWWARRKRRRAESTLRAQLGIGPSVALPVVGAALRSAHSVRTAASLAALPDGALFAGRDVWADLDAADKAAREASGGLLQHRAIARRNGADERRAVAALGRALRAGRGTRRDLLRDLDGSALLDALPLWVGTLADIDDLLPPVPRLFDLVILDEASQIDQTQWVVALARAKRVLVVGDPQQLRHICFVSDDDVRLVLAGHGLETIADRLDLRRVSAFDAAAAVAPVTWLDEHHRSVPHLIEFSARRFYPRPVHMATRHPSNDHYDAIDVVRVEGVRTDDGVNRTEVDRIGAIVAALLDRGAGSVGVITPMRAQAEALEAHMLARFSLEEIEQLELRIATVHGFQGDERDVVIVSLVLTPADLAGGRHFVEDPNLFNVMVTRARRLMTVVTSLGPGVGGLIGEWLAYGERPPRPPATGEPTPGWCAALADELRRTGLVVRAGYPVGRWTVDLCVGDGVEASGLWCAVHPDGPGAHIRRQLELRRSGWHLVDAFPNLWDGDVVRAALELHRSLTARSVGHCGG